MSESATNNALFDRWLDDLARALEYKNGEDLSAQSTYRDFIVEAYTEGANVDTLALVLSAASFAQRVRHKWLQRRPNILRSTDAVGRRHNCSDTAERCSYLRRPAPTHLSA